MLREDMRAPWACWPTSVRLRIGADSCEFSPPLANGGRSESLVLASVSGPTLGGLRTSIIGATKLASRGRHIAGQALSVD